MGSTTHPGRPQILVLKDEGPEAVALEGMLQAAGCEVVVRSPRTDAPLPGGRSFDVVVLDVALPGLDGLNVIRALGLERSQTTEFLARPVARDLLVDAVWRALAGNTAATTPDLSALAPRVDASVPTPWPDAAADEVTLEALVGQRRHAVELLRSARSARQDEKARGLEGSLAMLDREITARAQLMRMSR